MQKFTPKMARADGTLFGDWQIYPGLKSGATICFGPTALKKGN